MTLSHNCTQLDLHIIITWTGHRLENFLWPLQYNRLRSGLMGQDVHSRVPSSSTRNCDRGTWRPQSRNSEGTAGTIPRLLNAQSQVGCVWRMSPSGDSGKHLPLGCFQLQVKTGLLASYLSQEIWIWSDQVYFWSGTVSWSLSICLSVVLLVLISLFLDPSSFSCSVNSLCGQKETWNKAMQFLLPCLSFSLPFLAWWQTESNLFSSHSSTCFSSTVKRNRQKRNDGTNNQLTIATVLPERGCSSFIHWWERRFIAKSIRQRWPLRRHITRRSVSSWLPLLHLHHRRHSLRQLKYHQLKLSEPHLLMPLHPFNIKCNITIIPSLPLHLPHHHRQSPHWEN